MPKKKIERMHQMGVGAVTVVILYIEYIVLYP